MRSANLPSGCASSMGLQLAEKGSLNGLVCEVAGIVDSVAGR